MRQRLQLLTCLAVIGFTPLAFAQEQKPVTELESFIAHIWESSPAIAASKARIISAEAGKRAASKWQYNPEIEFGMEDVDGEDKTKTFGISQTIDWSGKARSSGKAASFELQAVRADHEQLRQNTALNVLSTLADYHAAINIYNLATERTNLMERFATLAQKSFKAGDIDRSEYNLAQLALSEAMIVQADTENALSESKQSLNSYIGFTLGSDFALPKLPKILPDLPNDFDNEQILIGLPYLQAIRSRENAAKTLISEAQKNRLPDPTISLVGGKDTGSDMVGFSVSIPLNIFNSYGAELDQAKADALMQAKEGQNSFHIAKSRLQAAHKSYQLSKKAWANWQANGAQTLSKQTDILDRKFKVGDLSATDYLVQVEQALDTQVAAKELHAKVWKSWFAWLGASGTINQWIKDSGE